MHKWIFYLFFIVIGLTAFIFLSFQDSLYMWFNI